MADVLVIAAIVLIVAAAFRHIRKAKKRGVKCVGCPGGCSCGGCCH